MDTPVASVFASDTRCLARHSIESSVLRGLAVMLMMRTMCRRGNTWPDFLGPYGPDKCVDRLGTGDRAVAGVHVGRADTCIVCHVTSVCILEDRSRA